jgi:uncharacterized protein (TIGR03435 family)
LSLLSDAIAPLQDTPWDLRVGGIVLVRAVLATLVIIVSVDDDWMALASGSVFQDPEATPAIERFDTVSIRETRDNTVRRLFREAPGGLTVLNATVMEIVLWAFDIEARDAVVEDAPAWLHSRQFDIVARTDRGPVGRETLRAMTRTMLEDRFGLESLVKSVERPVYLLVLAGADGKPGPEMRPSTARCQTDVPLDASASEPQKVFSMPRNCGVSSMGDGNALVAVFGTRVTMAQLAYELSRRAQLDRPVVDRTGLTAEFDFVALTPRDTLSPSLPPQGRFLSALQEQLGLKLESGTAVVDILVVRRVHLPTPN